MAKRGPRKVNKSQKIRDVLTEKGIDSSPSMVMALLKEKGVSVSAAQVSNVKAAMRLKASGMNGAKVRGGASSDDAIVNAIRFVRSVGSLAAARKALEEVAAIR